MKSKQTLLFSKNQTKEKDTTVTKCPFQDATLSKLKDILKQKKLKMTGKRDDLLKRIKRAFFFETHASSEGKKTFNFIYCNINKCYYLKEIKIVSNKKRFYLCADPTTCRVNGKINIITGRKEELSKEDIEIYCKPNYLDYELPKYMIGSHRRRSDMEEEDDEESEEEEEYWDE